MLSINHKRKFHDAWAFILFVVFSTGFNTYLAIEYCKGGFIVDEEIHYPFILSSLGVTLFFMLCNFVGLSFFTVVYIKTSVILSPLILLAVCYICSLNVETLACICTFHFVIIFSFIYYWKRIVAVGQILKHSLKILNSHFYTYSLGIILCTCLQVVQLFLFYSLDASRRNNGSFLTILFIFNLFWSMTNIVYFFKVYISSLVAYHFLEYEGEPVSVLKSSFTNTIYASGSISFAGLVIAIIKTLTIIVESDRNRNRNYTESRQRVVNFVRSCFSCFAVFLSSLLVEILELANDLSMPYIAVNGESYINSLRESFNLTVKKDAFPLLGLVFVDFSLFASSFGFLLCLFCISHYFFKFDPYYCECLRITQVLCVDLILIILYFTAIMVFSSSFLALTYLYIVNKEFLTSIDPSITESFSKSKETLEKKL